MVGDPVAGQPSVVGVGRRRSPGHLEFSGGERYQAEVTRRLGRRRRLGPHSQRPAGRTEAQLGDGHRTQRVLCVRPETAQTHPATRQHRRLPLACRTRAAHTAQVQLQVSTGTGSYIQVQAQVQVQLQVQVQVQM